ncbi:hypothetical protein E2562_028996 [Oryza meyeriana var. granulata]|uniref:Uncharacterized protein n=1 Tax=Oryza meyeriana var. granulata TaxID=110450 RepID=A0A6G1E353_9ORYZ|nr:hypothetical protein E2562_028996 [Oryza meyeriana var. granulata]
MDGGGERLDGGGAVDGRRAIRAWMEAAPRTDASPGRIWCPGWSRRCGRRGISTEAVSSTEAEARRRRRPGRRGRSKLNVDSAAATTAGRPPM